MPAAFPKTTFSIFMPVTLQDLGWNDHFQRAFDAVAKPGWMPGRLIRETKINFTALLDGGEDVDAVVSGKLWHDAATDAELPAVGDWVAIDPGEAGDEAVIRSILPRQTCFSRKAPGKSSAEQVLGTNVDIVAVVTEPGTDFNPRRMERYFTLIRRSGASPLILLNKTDLFSREEVEKAMQNPAMVKNLVCKEFNIRETSTESWLTFEQLDNRELFDLTELKPRYGIGGCDLSSTTDLTCATVLFMVPEDNRIYVLQMYFLPEDLLEKRVREDKIPYDQWYEQGLLTLTPGNKVHYKYVVEWFRKVQEEYDVYLFKCGYDSWSAQYFVEDMMNEFGREVMEPVIQGKKTLSGPMKSLGADLEKKRIIYNNNPILKWCLANTSVDVDKNDNIQPAKGNQGTRRIDGMASLLDAYVTLEKNMEEYVSMI